MFNDQYQLVVGKEYLSSFHKKLIAGTPTKIIFSGDSTTAGSYDDSAFFVDQLLSRSMLQNGITGVTTMNSGYPSKCVTDWINTYLAQDLAQNPDVYIVRWGINDACNGQTIYQFITNLRAGLSTIRTSKSLNSLAIVLMPPNAIDLSTYPGGYTAWCNWSEQVNPLIRQVARDFECCFIDIYQMFEDAANGGDWLFSDLVHPIDVANVWINDITFKVLFPTYFYTQSSVPYNGGTTLQNPQFPLLKGEWQDYAAECGVFNYYKDPFGIVHIEGGLKNGTFGAIAFTLPVGYRPYSMRCFSTDGGNNNIQVRASGDVLIINGSVVYTSLDGITFRAYQ